MIAWTLLSSQHMTIIKNFFIPKQRLWFSPRRLEGNMGKENTFQGPKGPVQTILSLNDQLLYLTPLGDIPHTAKHTTRSSTKQCLHEMFFSMVIVSAL